MADAPQILTRPSTPQVLSRPSKAQTILDVFDPKDDGGPVKRITGDKAVSKAHPVLTRPSAPQPLMRPAQAPTNKQAILDKIAADAKRKAATAPDNIETFFGNMKDVLGEGAQQVVKGVKGLDPLNPENDPSEALPNALSAMTGVQRIATAPLEAGLRIPAEAVMGKKYGGPLAGDVAALPLLRLGAKEKVPGEPAPKAPLSTAAADTKGIIRAETGTANRTISKAEAKLNQSYKLADNMTPEQQADYYNYVEGRSKNTTLADPGLQKFANDTKQIAEAQRAEFESLPDGEKMGFYQDYFPHLWDNPEAARKFSNDFIGKQGSSASTKARKYPTMAEGIAAGLKPKYSNPVQALSANAASVANFIASKRIVNEVIAKGDAKYYAPGQQPEGWVPLNGRFGERTRSYLKETEGDIEGIPITQAHALHEKLYAPKPVAQIYNDFYSKGLEATRVAQPFEIARTLSAANTAAELSLSGYHAMTTTAQQFSTQLTRIMKNASQGDWKGVANAVYKAATVPVPFVKGSTYRLGSKMIGQYKGLKDYGVDMESIAEHFERGGGKLGQDKLYRGSKEGGFLTSPGGMRGALKSIGEEAAKPGMTPKARAALNVFQRASEDVSAPLFEHYIPRIKTGVFAELMGDWIRQNPKATPEMISEARQRIIDLVDDRQGEMNMDNIFVPKLVKQTAALFLRAQGWDIGLVRQAGGGILDSGKIIGDLIKGKKIDPKLLDRPMFLASTMMTMALASAAYQYLKTGKAPDSMLDYMAPKTGGTTPYTGQPERTVLAAGHGREILNAVAPMMSEGALGPSGPASGIATEVQNKLATLPRNVLQAIENKDYFGRQIGNNTGPLGWVGSIPERVGHVAGGFMPFGLTEQGDKRQGSNLSGVEREFLGMRPARREIADPEGYRRAEEKKAVKEHKDAVWFKNMMEEGKEKPNVP